MDFPDRLRVLLLDIEGTTTPIDFVHRVLFPYAQERMPLFLQEHHAEAETAKDLSLLQEEYRREDPADPALPLWNSDADLDSCTTYLDWLMQQDRKSTALKSLQGKIWQQGYETGEIESQVYSDVVALLRRWHADGGLTYIFSSGSVLAQQLLFRHSDHGDLTPLLTGYFDTTTGPKREAGSYQAIAAKIGAEPSTILFASDTPEEIAAAQTAGMFVALAIRSDNAPLPAQQYPTFQDFLIASGVR